MTRKFGWLFIISHVKYSNWGEEGNLRRQIGAHCVPLKRSRTTHTTKSKKADHGKLKRANRSVRIHHCPRQNTRVPYGT